MSRSKTENLPDLSSLLTPKNQLMLAVEHAVLRGQDWARASAPIAEQIAARLAGVITLDLIRSGQRLLEKDISEVLHVSRAPVREAMRILERDRLVEFQARRGAIVTA
ncbi:GntR family transcriptional regulator, partial [Cupriavidus basilensis]